MTAQCGFCQREFGSSQGVRAHLKSCRNYQQQRQKPSAPPPPAPRMLTDEEHIQRLFGSVPSSARRPATSPEPLPPTPRPTPRPDRDEAHAQREQQARREREAQREAQRDAQQRDAARQQATEQRQRAERTRALIQHVKCLVVDCYFSFNPIPPEAIAEAKEEIERKFATLPILELPQSELQQHATAIRERVYAPHRKTPMQKSVAAPPRRDVATPPVHSQPKENAMPMIRILSGDFYCPGCDAEFELDRTPEKEAVCADCGVQLEEFEDEGEDEE